MNEQGQWNDKTKTAYALDENGNRIMGKNGKWKRIRIDTVDWNDRKYCEIWRHEWETQQNAALEKAGKTERVDMRSFKRQGLETAPQVHLGSAAFALEKKGIRTGLGEHNKAVKIINGLFAAIKRGMKTFADWLKELNAVMQCDFLYVLTRQREAALVNRYKQIEGEPGGSRWPEQSSGWCADESKST